MKHRKLVESLSHTSRLQATFLTNEMTLREKARFLRKLNKLSESSDTPIEDRLQTLAAEKTSDIFQETISSGGKLYTVYTLTPENTPFHFRVLCRVTGANQEKVYITPEKILPGVVDLVAPKFNSSASRFLRHLDPEEFYSSAEISKFEQVLKNLKRFVEEEKHAKDFLFPRGGGFSLPVGYPMYEVDPSLLSSAEKDLPTLLESEADRLSYISFMLRRKATMAFGDKKRGVNLANNLSYTAYATGVTSALLYRSCYVITGTTPRPIFSNYYGDI